jgi:hypothetical protein
MNSKTKILIGVVLAAALAYGLDDLSARFGIPSRPRFSTFTVYKFYRIDEKFNKFSYEPLSIAQEQCVNALFPHGGVSPCWYLSRHTNQVVSAD